MALKKRLTKRQQEEMETRIQSIRSYFDWLGTFIWGFLAAIRMSGDAPGLAHTSPFFVFGFRLIEMGFQIREIYNSKELTRRKKIAAFANMALLLTLASFTVFGPYGPPALVIIGITSSILFTIVSSIKPIREFIQRVKEYRNKNRESIDKVVNRIFRINFLLCALCCAVLLTIPGMQIAGLIGIAVLASVKVLFKSGQKYRETHENQRAGYKKLFKEKVSDSGKKNRIKHSSEHKKGYSIDVDTHSNTSMTYENSYHFKNEKNTSLIDEETFQPSNKEENTVRNSVLPTNKPIVHHEGLIHTPHPPTSTEVVQNTQTLKGSKPSISTLFKQVRKSQDKLAPGEDVVIPKIPGPSRRPDKKSEN